MKNKYELKINWEIEIPNSQVSHLHGSSKFTILKNGSVLLAYNEVTKHGQNKCGKLARITKESVEDIFTTNYYVWSHVADGNDVYLVAIGEPGVNREHHKSILFKIDDTGVLKWQYQLEESIETLPAITPDSLFIADYGFLNGAGGLYRLNKNGGLIFKKRIGTIGFDPFILEDRNEILLCFYTRPRILEIRDFEGNIKKQKNIDELGRIVFSRNARGNVFAAINHTIVALDNELNFLWEYKPEKGQIHTAPVFDSAGNMYVSLYGRRLVSLKPNGKERWIENVGYHGSQPIMMDDNNVMIVTSADNGNKLKEEMNISHLEIFSNDGKRLADYTLPGYYINAIKDNNTLFVVLNSIRGYPEQELADYAIKVFSLGHTNY